VDTILKGNEDFPFIQLIQILITKFFGTTAVSFFITKVEIQNALSKDEWRKKHYNTIDFLKPISYGFMKWK